MHPTRLIALVAAGASLGALSSCGGATPYHPAAAEARTWGDGYHEVAIEPGRWRVVFVGNDLTSRETVETYLLYRAAELTLSQGFSWFVATERRTDPHSEWRLNPPSAAGYPGWRPAWRQHAGSRWGPWNPDAAPEGWDLDRTTRYEASAEVVMGGGAKPSGDPRAMDARAVVETLRSRIVLPPSARP